MFFSYFRSRSPFRKNFNERSYNEDDFQGSRRDYSPNRRSRVSGGGGAGGGGGGGGGSSSGAGGGAGAKKRVFVNNIPFECRWMEIKDLFREKGFYIYMLLFFYMMYFMLILTELFFFSSRRCDICRIL